jgi:hypothetical protein
MNAIKNDTIYPVTPWAATVHDDIGNAELLAESFRKDYWLQFYNTGDSLWLAVSWPKAGRIAFRLAFGMNSDFNKVALTPDGDNMLVTASTRLGDYRIFVSFPDADKPIFRYTTTFRAAFEMLIPYWPRDIVPLTADGRVENTAGRIHTEQEGGRSGQLFFSYTRPKTGSVLYFQNLTAMSAYCDVSETSLDDSVGGKWPEIGFQFPVNKDKPIPADIEYTISDAFVYPTEEIPDDDFAVVAQFLDCLSGIYVTLPRPEAGYHDWPEIAEKSLRDLYENHGCWTQTEGNSYLNAYVEDYDTPAEIMVQLAVLLPLREYLDWRGESHPLKEQINANLDVFYDKRVKSIVRWHPALEDKLDKSEEQKQEMVMDSWYLHHPLLNLARLALKGEPTAKRMFLDSIDYAINVAQHFDYQWPVFYKMTTLEVIKAETSPGKGGETDVPGSYAHVMVLAWQLTGDKRFLREAAKAVKKMRGLAFDIFYQANNTAFAAGALLELYIETREEHYLDLSYCCMAGIFRNLKLWNCGYGFGKNFPGFFGVYPLNDAPYTAAYEEMEVYAAIDHYLRTAADANIDILPGLKIMLPEFAKYAASRLPYYFPPMLPSAMIAKKAKTGAVEHKLWIPVEDICEGWEASGSVGQEVYGAGLPFGIVPRQYHKLNDDRLILFLDYPASDFKFARQSVTFRLLGDQSLDCGLRLMGTDFMKMDFEVSAKIGGIYKDFTGDENVPVYKVPGNAQVRISWRGKKHGK